MTTPSSTLPWKIPWVEEPGGLQSMGSRRVGHDWAGSRRVGHDWATSLSLFTFMHWRSKWQPSPMFLPGESQGLGSLVAAVYGVAQSRTWLKQLHSSKSKHILNLLKESRDTHHFHLSVSACLTSVETTDISNDPDFLVERENVVR